MGRTTRISGSAIGVVTSTSRDSWMPCSNSTASAAARTHMMILRAMSTSFVWPRTSSANSRMKEPIEAACTVKIVCVTPVRPRPIPAEKEDMGGGLCFSAFLNDAPPS